MISVKMRFTHGDMVSVVGVLKLICNEYTVRNIEAVTTIIMNNRYFPMSGMTREVGGFMSDSSRKNTVRASRMEMDSVIFSPLSVGR